MNPVRLAIFASGSGSNAEEIIRYFKNHENIDVSLLLSNNPDKARQLRRCGVGVSEQVPTGVHLSTANGRYLAAKAQRGSHTLDIGISAG